ncbi:MAG: hypothetical protein QNK03_01955 [Myxococcota bacterium]|nr:hypothetical protein [Myxococcota bacterium]
MDVRTRCIGLALLGLVLATPAGALQLEFTGTYTVQIEGIPTLFSAAGSGIAEVDTGISPAAFTLPESVFEFGTFTTFATSPNEFLSLFAVNLSGSFSRTAGGQFRGTLPLTGRLLTTFLAPTSGGLRHVFFTTVDTTGGASKQTTVILKPTVSPIGDVSIGGPPITTTFTSTEFGLATFFATLVGGEFRTGTDTRTPGGIGMVRMTVPISFRSGGRIGNASQSLATLTLEFTPEPTAGLAGGAAALALAALGARRARRR